MFCVKLPASFASNMLEAFTPRPHMCQERVENIRCRSCRFEARAWTLVDSTMFATFLVVLL